MTETSKKDFKHRNEKEPLQGVPHVAARAALVARVGRGYVVV